MRLVDDAAAWVNHLHPVAVALGSLRDDVVFLGGSVLPFMVTDPAVTGLRPTHDIDVIVEVASRRAYATLEEDLRRLGFRNDTSDGAPICRWLVAGTIVGVMPTDPSILGFSNRWYPYSLRTARPINLDAGLDIQIVSPVAFLATKLEAFLDPGRLYGQDFRASPDLEDVLTVLDGRQEIESEVEGAEREVRGFLRETFHQFLSTPAFLDSVSGHLEAGPTNAARTRLLLTRIERLTALP